MNFIKTIGEEDLRLMIQIRCVEKKLLDLFSQGKIRGTTHTCIGQEAVAVGVTGCLDMDLDTVCSNHRGHGHFIASTKNIRGFLAEVMGKEGAVCKGMGGSQHLYCKNFYSNGVQGGVPAMATGIGLAHKLEGHSAISISFIGDGTFGEGLTYEVLNMASLWSLPVLYVVEDNDVAQSTPSHLNRAGSIKDRFRSFSIQCIEEDGQDLKKVSRATGIALDHIRSKKGPFGLIFKTSRFSSHSKGDDHRSKEEIKNLMERDPIDIFASTEKKWKGVTASLENECNSQLEKLVSELDQCKPAQGYVRHFIYTVEEKENFGFKGTVSERLNESLKALMGRNKKTVMIGEDILDPYGGAFKVTKGLSSLYPRQVLTTPISEAGIVAMANGLALRGFFAIAEIMFGDFLFLAADQMINHAAKFQSMYGRDLDISCVIRTPMGGKRGYGPTHSQSVEKYFMGVPGLMVVAINQWVDPAFLLEFSVEKAKQPVLFLENKLLYNQKVAQVNSAFKKKVFFENNGTRIVQVSPKEETADCVLVGYGGVCGDLMEAADRLYADDVYVEVLMPELLSPLGDQFLKMLTSKKVPILFVEESGVDFGWASEVSTRLNENGVHVPVRRVGAKGKSIPSSIYLEQKVLPNVDRIVESVLTWVRLN